MNKRIVIIGGVAGGATALARLRRLNEEAEIILLERGAYVSFANCGLPYYIGGVIQSRDALFVSTPEAIMAKYNVDVRVQHEVLSIDREKKMLSVRQNQTGACYDLAYDTLLLSTGSRPIQPPVEGFDGANVFTLWNIPDTDRVYRYIEDHEVGRAVVIGGGFIGLEMAENLAHRGIRVTVIEKANQVMAPLDYDMAQMVHHHLVEKGVDLILGNGVSRITHASQASQVILEDGRSVEAQLVILSIGIRANSELAKEAGLKLNERGGVVVDEHMRTSDEDIYCVGDVIEVEDFVLGGKTMVPLAGPANKQGRIAADNILLGDTSTYRGTQGTSIAQIFDLTVAATGANEKALQRNGQKYGIDYRISIIHANSHAGYYPDASMLALKLIFSNEGVVLGAQIVGYDGVDKRIDVIATAIRFGATVEQLTELELAYAPPYSSAKDPVNMVAYTAVNQLNGLVQVLRVEELESVEENVCILDVREEMERDMGYIEGSVNISLDQLRERLSTLDRSKKYVAYCAVGLRGYLAARILAQNGFDVKNLLGGFRSYSEFYLDPNRQSASTRSMDDGGIPIREESGSEHELNVCGLCCPGPIVQVAKAMETLDDGARLIVKATDPGFYSDICSWAENTGHELVERHSEKGTFFATLRKGKKKRNGDAEC